MTEASGPPDLTVIMVTWNVRDRALASLERTVARAGGLKLQFVVVDNASEDGTVPALRERFPDAEVLANTRNVGFPRANNQGLERARGRHVLFLNPDAEPADGATLPALVEALDDDAGLGAVGPRLEYPDGRLQTECARRDYRLRHILWEAFYLHVLRPRSRIFAHQVMGEWDHRGGREVEALSGAFLMARREAALMVGGLPDEVFMYHEDLAFCLRLRRRGWRLACLADVVGIHEGGASTSQQLRPVQLLEGEVQVRLIGERSGPVWRGAARLLFGVRSLVRLLLSVVLIVLPGLSGLRARRPAAFQPRRHALLLLWTFRPSALEDRLPRPPPREERGPRVLLVGPTPPPYHGNSVWTAQILGSERVRGCLELEHLDTSDRRTISNLGRLDPRNVALALRHGLELWDRCRRFRPRVVYVPISQNTLGFLRDALLIRLASRSPRGRPAPRVVVHLHGGELDRFVAGASPPVRALVRRTLARAAEAWVLARGLRRQFRGLVPDDRIRVVENGVPDWTDGRARARSPAPGGELLPSVLHLGELSRRKGVFELLEAVQRLGGGGLRLRLVLAGSWRVPSEEREARDLLQSVEESGVEVVCPGVVTGAEKWQLFRDAALFVLPSHGEGQPLTILEAMAGGVAVVATPVGAVPDAVWDGETGLLVPPGDVPALAGALARLLEHPEERRTLGRKGRARYLERFTAEAMADRFVEAVKQVSVPDSQKEVP